MKRSAEASAAQDIAALRSALMVREHLGFRRASEVLGVNPSVLSRRALGAALDYVARHEEIWEAILSGGDPLVLSERRLAQAGNRRPLVARQRGFRGQRLAKSRGHPRGRAGIRRPRHSMSVRSF